jgi:hypothetical protein
MDLKLLNLAYEVLLSVVKVNSLSSSLKHNPDPSCLPILSMADSLIPFLHHLHPLSTGFIPFNNSMHKLNPAGLQSYHSIIYVMLGISSCPSMPTHMHP